MSAIERCLLQGVSANRGSTVRMYVVIYVDRVHFNLGEREIREERA